MDAALQRGADVNAEDCSDGGQTALHKAASNGHMEIVTRLLQRNADTLAKDDEGKYSSRHYKFLCLRFGPEMVSFGKTVFSTYCMDGILFYINPRQSHNLFSVPPVPARQHSSHAGVRQRPPWGG